MHDLLSSRQNVHYVFPGGTEGTDHNNMSRESPTIVPTMTIKRKYDVGWSKFRVNVLSVGIIYLNFLWMSYSNLM